MTERLRWGILGAGGIAAAMTKDLQLIGAPVTAVGSRSADKATAFADRYGIPNRHGSYEALVADPEVDAIYVATPHPGHAPHALLAIAGGKHVLVEKPFTVNAREAQQVVDAARAAGVVVLEAMWTRWLPHMIRLRDLIAAGAIGEPRALIATHAQNVPVDPLGRMYAPELGGGALLDLGIYPVSFAWDLFGEPATVRAISTPTDTGVDARTSILLGYESGAHAVLHTALDARDPNRASILGSRGRVELDGVWYTPTVVTVFDERGEVAERIDLPVEGRGMQFQALALERVVAAGGFDTDELPTDESIAIMGTLDEIRRQIGLRYPGE